MWKLRVPMLSLVLVMMGVSPAYGDETEVDCEDDPGALVAAVAAAPAGATLEIEGRCVGTIIIDKDLTIEGEDDAVIDGGGSGPVVDIGSDVTVVLEDLKVTGGKATDPFAFAGIYNGGDLTLRKVSVVNNHAEATGFSGHGFVYNLAVGGIQNPSGATLTLEDSTVARNTASVIADNWDGGYRAAFAIGGVSDGGTATLNDSTVSRNSATARRTADAMWVGAFAYAGIQSFDLGALTLNHTSVSRNTATAIAEGDGTLAIAVGGVINFDGALSMNGVTLSANTADAEAPGVGWANGFAVGGLATEYTYYTGMPVTITDSVVSGNSASGTYAAGGIETYFSNATVKNTVVKKNQASSPRRAVGGIENGEGSSLTLTGGKVVKNTAVSDGVSVGGIGAHPLSSVAIDGTIIKKNTPWDCDFPHDACPT